MSEKTETKPDSESIQITWDLFEDGIKNFVIKAQDPKFYHGIVFKAAKELVPAFPEDIPSFLKESKKVLFAKGVDPEKLMSLANKLISIYEKIINHAEKNGITLVFGGNATKSSIMGMTAVSTSNLATKVMRQYISLMKTPTDDYQEKK